MRALLVVVGNVLESNRLKANASRNCWTIHKLVGCFVTLRSKMRRRSWAMTKEAVEYTEGDRGNREEIHRSDGFPVVAKKGEPAPGWVRVPEGNVSSSEKSFFRGNIKTEH
jgi:hypothetical protein